MLNINLKTISLNRKVSFYLILSYLYYELNESLVSDSQFDDLCKDLLVNYDKVKSSSHPNKNLIDKFNLDCGTNIGTVYTNRIKSSAIHLLNNHEEIYNN